MENESSSNIDYQSNIYTDGEKYFWVLYNGSRYHFDDLGYNFEDEAQRALNLRMKELKGEV